MSELVFSVFGKAEVNDGSRVDIPDAVRADFQRAAAYFEAHTNRHTLTLNFTGDVAKAFREAAGDSKLTDEGTAKLFAKMVRQWAESTGRSSTPHRDGTKVTFRIARKKTASANGTVTVSSVTADGRVSAH